MDRFPSRKAIACTIVAAIGLSALFIVSALGQPKNKKLDRTNKANKTYFDRVTPALIPDHECAFCHDMQNGDLKSPPPYEDLCLSCHGTDGQSILKASAHTNRDGGQYGEFHITCLECHNPHDNQKNWLGGKNIKMVGQVDLYNWPRIAFIDTPNSGRRSVVFESRGTGVGDPARYSFADSDEDLNGEYDGVCEVCHTQTTYHRNDQPDLEHYTGNTCTTCHTHEAGFTPVGGDCLGCHSNPQDNGDNLPPGGRRAVIDEFGLNSGHLHSAELEASDCTACHYMGQHQSGYVNLKDPDFDGTWYNYETISPPELETYCINCHDDNGALAGGGITPFSDGKIVPNVKGVPGSYWASSAHADFGTQCLDCHTEIVHGSDNIKLLQQPQVSTLCVSCHYDPDAGGIENIALSGAAEANDILEAFNESVHHNLGAIFQINDIDYTLECTTCHNPHVVTGKHWEVEVGFSPITRPDFSDPVENPRAMGKILWGVAPEEKMDAFAARGAGTGGWYFNVLRGLPYGTGSLPMDQPAKYQPPKKGPGYDWEFDGADLPDYPSLCLDCHTYRMSAKNPPVNWGQADIECTDNRVDPPDQRIECGAQHGFGLGARPYAWDPNNGMYGAGGNPDPIFQQPGVKRGRGAGQWTRWPYEPADRNAGINYVLSCTDCHEAHGSPLGSMLRTTINNKPGSTNWNTGCNACHYYYGYQHAGKSCGNASCHEADSIHRIIHVTSSSGVNLWRPPGVPEIWRVDGAVGSDLLTVTFYERVYSKINQQGTLEIADFILVDNDNDRTITEVIHTLGDSVVQLRLSSPLDEQNDLGVDTISAAAAAVFDDLGLPAELKPYVIQDY